MNKFVVCLCLDGLAECHNNKKIQLKIKQYYMYGNKDDKIYKTKQKNQK